MHLGGFVNGGGFFQSTIATMTSVDSSGSLSDYGGSRNSFSRNSFSRNSNGSGARPTINSFDARKFESIEEAAQESACGATNGAADTVSDADVFMSEEIFGKAFRGGPKAAAGLVARLEREVTHGGIPWEKAI